MWNFLTFERFISQDILVFFYYMFALIVPIFLWSVRFYILQKIPFLERLNSNIKDNYKNLTKERKIVIIMIFIMLFFCMELCLRMMFETMIGYFDMHDYLHEIAKQRR